MIAIGFAFNDFDFVIHSFQSSGMDRIVTMVENSIPIAAKHLGEFRHFSNISSRLSRDIFAYGAGIGLYSAGMKERMSAKAIYPRGNVFYSDRFWSAETKTILGWHGGVSAEYSLGRNLALVAELQGRYLKLNEFRGNVEYTTNFGTGLTIREGGYLHFFGSPESYYDMDIPLPYHVYGNWRYIERKAVLDLSGFSFRIGIRIRII